jgi:hypothetical protein
MRGVPTGTQKSTATLTRGFRSTRVSLLEKIERQNKKVRTRYAFAIGLFIFSVAALAITGVGGVVQEASARENTLGGYLTNLLGNDRNQSNTRNNNQNSETQQQVAPTQTTPTAPVESVVTSEPVTANPVVPPAVSSSAFAPAQAAQSIPDTASEIAATTSAQAAVASQPVTYTSQQISANTRDQLLIAAAIALISGAIILIISNFGMGSAALAKAKSIRIRIPVREAATN